MTSVASPATSAPSHAVGVETPENRAVNLIRSVGAIVVVFAHVRIMFFQDFDNGVAHSTWTTLVYAFSSIGPGIVITFFVLSGYWVGGGVLDKVRAGRFSWSLYGQNRLTRLWLVLLPALLVTFVADTAGRYLSPAAGPYADGPSYSGVLSPVRHSITDLLGNVVFLQGIWVPKYGTDVSLWSLANEFWYYLIFPALLIVFVRRFRLRSRVIAAVVVVAGSLIAGPAVMLLFPTWLLGAVVATQRQRIVDLLLRAPRAAVVAARLLAFAATAGAVVGTKLVALPGIVSSLAVALPASVLIATLVVDLGWRGVPGKLLDAGSWLAGSSYSLYAVHMPLVVLVSSFVIPSAAQRWEMTVPHLLVAVAIVACAAVVGIGFAAVTEKRTAQVRAAVRRLLGRLTAASRARSGEAAAAAG